MASESKPSTNIATAAYAAAKKYADPSKQVSAQTMNQEAGGMQAGGGFGGFLQSAIDKVSVAGNKADVQAAQAVSGRADLVDVVTAVAESEAALETLVAVRDKVIAAYEEIMRMPI